MASMHSRFVIILASAVAASALSLAGLAQTTSTQAKPKPAPAKAAAPVKAPAKPAPAKPVASTVKAPATAAKPATASAKPAVYTTTANPAPVTAVPANGRVATANQASSPAATNTNQATLVPVASTNAAPGAAPAAGLATNPNTASLAGNPGVAPSNLQQPNGVLQNNVLQNGASQNGAAAAAADTGAGVMPGAANGATAATGFAAGLGTFRYGDVTLTAFNCLRAGTRVFCDFDETKTATAQLPAGWAFNQVRLVVGSGRVYTPHVAHFVDADGSTFDTAEISSNVPVRMILEYDDVPTQYTGVALAYGTDRISSVPVNLMPATQAPNTISPRQAAASQAQGQTAGNDPSAAADGAADKVSQGIDKVNSTKSTLKNLWKKASTVTQNQ